MASTSVYYEALLGVQSALQTLLAPAKLPPASIFVDEVAIPREKPKPYISISPAQRPERIPGGSNSQEDRSYPILVAYVADPDVSQLDYRLTVRQQIIRRFQMQHLPTGSITLASDQRTEVEPSVPIDLAAYTNQGLFVSAVIVWTIVREAKS